MAAVCELDDGSRAARLWKIVRDDAVCRPTFEQACIDWRVPLLGDVWRSRSLEQCLRLVVDLQLTEHVPRMLELLDHQRAEVCITAAWALRHQRPEMGQITRMAGLWACGKMWEGEENADLAKQLCTCIADTQSLYPEPETVRFCAMLALGWLADPETVDDIKAHGEAKPAAIGYASEWALQRISK